MSLARLYYAVIVLLPGSAHLLWAWLVYKNDAALYVTALSDFAALDRVGSVVVFALAGVAAVAHLAIPQRCATWRVLTILPQQLMLFVSAQRACRAAMESAFADGVVRDSEFILSDQYLWIAIAVAHLAAVVAPFLAGKSRWISEHG